MGAPLDLLEKDIKLKDAVLRRLRRIDYYNGLFVILMLALIIYYFNRRPAEVKGAMDAMDGKILKLELKIEELRQATEAHRRAKDSAQVERYRMEAAKSELEGIEKKYK